MKKTILFLFISFVVGCASTESVISDYDEDINFSSYSTFVICIDDLFVENTSFPNYDNNFIRALLSDAVESEMKSLGHKTNVFDPQLQAGFKLVVEEIENTFKNCDLDDNLNYWHECTINREVYTQETLVIYVSDFKKNQIIWQASIDCNLNKSKNNLENYINDLVKKIFKHYPKQQKKSN